MPAVHKRASKLSVQIRLFERLTQRSVFPGRLIEEPLGRTEPDSAVHGPDSEDALAIEILFPVVKRKYMPSEAL